MRVLVLGGTGPWAPNCQAGTGCRPHALHGARSAQGSSCRNGAASSLAATCWTRFVGYALEDQEAVIDAATARATDSESVYRIDWDGKLNLYNQCRAKGVRRVVFTLLEAERFRSVPLMDIKHRTEQMLLEGFDVTILRTCAFKGVIGQFAIPVLESQTVGERQHADRLHEHPGRGPLCGGCPGPRANHWWQPEVVGPKAWNTGEVQLCERLARKEARVIRVPPALMQTMQGLVSFFEPGVNIAERLAFAEVTGGGVSLTAPMEESYEAFGLDPAETTGLEAYLEEYFSSILKRLREMEADLDKDAKKKLPF